MIYELVAQSKKGCAPVKANTEAVSLAEKLGLNIQVERLKKRQVEGAFTPLSKYEIEIWREFCPTHYRERELGRESELGFYDFDNIPIPVLEYWNNLKETYAFDRFEIWTAEINNPLLIGRQGPNFYLLARWGLESPGALPYEEVRKSIRRRRMCPPLIFLFLVGFMMVLALVLRN